MPVRRPHTGGASQFESQAIDQPLTPRKRVPARRPCSAPPAVEKARGSSKRPLFDHARRESQEEQPPLSGGRRHVPPPPEHLAGGASQVVYNDGGAKGRRHAWPPPRASSVSNGPPQKRHLYPPEHLLGGRIAEPGAEEVRGRRHWPQAYSGVGAAAVLAQCQRPLTSAQAAVLRTPTSPGDGRRFEKQPFLARVERPFCNDNLFGCGLLFSADAEMCKPNNALRHIPQPLSLIGARYRGSPQPSPSARRWQAPRDHLFGASPSRAYSSRCSTTESSVCSTPGKRGRSSAAARSHSSAARRGGA